MANVRSIDRMRQLPAAFSVNQAARLFEMDKRMLSVYLARLQRMGLIKKAGPKAGIYYNVLLGPPKDSDVAEAIRIAYPSAVLYGASVLHNAGWTTQIPQAIHIVVLDKGSYPSLDGVEVYRRPLAWYQRHAQDIVQSGRDVDFETYGLPALRPLACLEDMRAVRDGWVPEADDLMLPDDIPSEILDEAPERAHDGSRLTP